jgi:hypothetical protein
MQVCATLRSPSYDPNDHRVVICQQYPARLAREAALAGVQDDAAYVRDVSRFMVAHEMGHAVIDLFGLPIVGREEDAADQFAAFLFLEHRRPDPIQRGYTHFAVRAHYGLRDDDAVSDVHSLDAQRRSNFGCWLFGSDSITFASYGSRLPSMRRKHCPEEYARLRDAWRTLLATHQKP